MHYNYLNTIIMKKILLWFLSFFICIQLNAQFHSVSLDFFPPIVTPGMLQFYKTDNVLKQTNSYSRDYIALGSSASIKFLHKSLLIGYRFGLVQRTIHESNIATIINEAEEEQNVENMEIYVSYSYNQKHIVQSISCGKQQTFEKLTIGIQTEIPLILYGKGHAKLSESNNYSANTSTQIQTISSGFATGIGAGVQISYMVSTHFSIGLNISEYLLYTNFTNPSTIVYSDSYYNIDNQIIIDDTKLTQLQFSNISPSLSISYLFNTSTKAFLSR